MTDGCFRHKQQKQKQSGGERRVEWSEANPLLISAVVEAGLTKEPSTHNNLTLPPSRIVRLHLQCGAGMQMHNKLLCTLGRSHAVHAKCR